MGSPQSLVAFNMCDTDLRLTRVLVCALLFHTSFTLRAGTVRATSPALPRLHQSQRDIEWQDNIVAGGRLGSLPCYCVHTSAAGGARMCAPRIISAGIRACVQLICEARRTLQAHTTHTVGVL